VVSFDEHEVDYREERLDEVEMEVLELDEVLFGS